MIKKIAPVWGQRIVRTLLKLYIFIFYRLTIVGIENVPDKGKVLICPNHVSNQDILFIGIRLKRIIRWMAKAELWKFPPLGWFVEKFGAFPVRREKSDVGAVRTAVELLHEEDIVGIFAEGSRVRTSAKEGYKIHSGAAMLAIKTCSPIVPVGIKGGTRLFGKIEIVFGKPFLIDASCDQDYSHSEYVAFSREILRKAYALVGEKVFDERLEK